MFKKRFTKWKLNGGFQRALFEFLKEFQIEWMDVAQVFIYSNQTISIFWPLWVTEFFKEEKKGNLKNVIKRHIIYDI